MGRILVASVINCTESYHEDLGNHWVWWGFVPGEPNHLHQPRKICWAGALHQYCPTFLKSVPSHEDCYQLLWTATRLSLRTHLQEYDASLESDACQSAQGNRKGNSEKNWWKCILSRRSELLPRQRDLFERIAGAYWVREKDMLHKCVPVGYFVGIPTQRSAIVPTWFPISAQGPCQVGLLLSKFEWRNHYYRRRRSSLRQRN